MGKQLSQGGKHKWREIGYNGEAKMPGQHQQMDLRKPIA